MNYLPKMGVPKETVEQLVNVAISPDLLHEMEGCTWLDETNEVQTPGDVEDDLVERMEAQDWYQDVFALDPKQFGIKGKKGKKKYANAKALYDLDGAHSVETLHDRPAGKKGKGYVGDPGQPTLKFWVSEAKAEDLLSEKKKRKSSSSLKKMSKGELLKYVTKLQAAEDNSSVSSDPGSAPRSASDKSSDGSSSEEGSSSSSSGSSDSDSSSSSAGSAGSRTTATSR